MFPYVRLPKSNRLGIVLLIASLVVFNLTSEYRNNVSKAVNPNDNNDVAYLGALESHLQGKAAKILSEVTSDSFSVDLNLELDTAQTTITTYDPKEKILVCATEDQASDSEGSHNKRQEKWELTGTWSESVDVRPRIKTLKCCVTLTADQELDNDLLYSRLAYALGIDLSRGDLLRIVYR